MALRKSTWTVFSKLHTYPPHPNPGTEGSHHGNELPEKVFLWSVFVWSVHKCVARYTITRICENHQLANFILEKWVKWLLTKLTDTGYTGDSMQPKAKLQIHKTTVIKWNMSRNCSTRHNAHFLWWLRPGKAAPFSEWEE